MTAVIGEGMIEDSPAGQMVDVRRTGIAVGGSNGRDNAVAHDVVRAQDTQVILTGN